MFYRATSACSIAALAFQCWQRCTTQPPSGFLLSSSHNNINSLDFAVNRFLMKLFRTSDMEVMKFCQSAFNFVLPSVQIAKRRVQFVKKSTSFQCHDLSFILCSSSLISQVFFFLCVYIFVDIFVCIVFVSFVYCLYHSW